MQTLTPVSNTRRIFELAAVVSTGIGKFIFMDYLNWRLPFIVTAIVAWSAYVWWRHKSNPGILSYWGFRTDNFNKALKVVLPFGLLAIVAFVIIGIVQSTINVSWHIIPILMIYPLWGIIQQFLVIALVAGNLQDLKIASFNKPIIILLTALFFGAIHYPFYWLVIGTFILALFYGYVYLKVRNIWVLGLFHGWLGALFFYTVVNRDPFVEVF